MTHSFQPPCPLCGRYHMNGCSLRIDAAEGDFMDEEKETDNMHRERYARSSSAITTSATLPPLPPPSWPWLN